MGRPVTGFHTRTVPVALGLLLSLVISLAVASILPSGLNATPVTPVPFWAPVGWGSRWGGR